jgi:[ribosomal protein S18]-alanine N-acetyltransferase
MSAEANSELVPGFIIVWEFRPQPEKRREFEEAYGPEGIWAQFFRQGEGYIRTELHVDPKSPERYFTLDFWESPAGFEDFKQKYPAEYRAIDAKCESLTTEEKFLGSCETPEHVRTLLSGHGAEINPLSPQIVVRAATAADIGVMLLLEQAATTAAHWSEKAYQDMFDPAAPVRLALVAQGDSGILVGFIVAHLIGDDCEVENIVVAPPQQRRGIGRRLLRALLDAARAKIALRMFLQVRESNFAARKLYERSGFAIFGRRNSYYRDPDEDALLYRIEL